VVNTAANEYDPTISGRWVRFGQMAEPRSRIVLFDRRTGTVRRVVARFTMLWPGQVNGVYATWEGRRQFRYHIPSGTTRVLPVLDGTYQHSPAVSADGTVYVCRVPRDGPSSADRPARARQTTVLHRLPGGVDVADIYKAVDR
jgi:hypothetical protein